MEKIFKCWKCGGLNLQTSIPWPWQKACCGHCGEQQ